MFSWATQQLENLVQTVAPPPTDAQSRYVYCIQRGDDVSAQSCLAEMDPLSTVVQPTKGSYPLHLACQYSANNIIRQLMQIPGANVHVMDYAGNTSLHYACLSDNKASIDTVRLLVTQFGASVVAKNSTGQTPYDLATINSIRQYLLPLQLQQETRDALDNGGIGLPPGIDMGGLQIRNSALPPPPIGGLSPPPSTPTSTNTDPDFYGMMTTPSPTVPAQNPVSNTHVHPTAPPPAPSSGQHSYSRTGHSSAAIFSSKYKSDGFHSSSSDVNLQIKYGHSSSGNLASSVPPPPSSGNMTSTSAPSSVGQAGGANPYAAFGGGAMRSRYPTYSTPGLSQAQAPVASGYNFSVAPPAPGNFTMFNPAGAQPDIGSQQQPVPQQAATFAHPAQVHTFPTTPTSSFLPPPPLSSMSQSAYPHAHQPQQNITSPYNHDSTQQVFSANLPPVNVSPFRVEPRQSPASGNAQQLFSAPAVPISGNAQQHFSAPVVPLSGNAQQRFSAPAVPISGNAQQLFSAPAVSISGNAQQLFSAPAAPISGINKGNIAKLTYEQGQSDDGQQSTSHTQQIEQSIVSSDIPANQYIVSSNALPTTTEQQGDLVSSNAIGFNTVNHPNQDAASMFATPMDHVKEEVPNPESYTVTHELPEQAKFHVSGLVEAKNDATSAASTKVQRVSCFADADDGMMDVPLDQSATFTCQQASEPASIQTATALFSSIGLPPPPFSSKN